VCNSKSVLVEGCDSKGVPDDQRRRALCDVPVGDSWGSLVLRWSEPWMWELLHVFIVHDSLHTCSAASAARVAAARRRILYVTGVRSEPHCSAVCTRSRWSLLIVDAGAPCNKSTAVVYLTTCKRWSVWAKSSVKRCRMCIVPYRLVIVIAWLCHCCGVILRRQSLV